MPWVILSDIHANLEALEAVLADAAAHGADRILCLGDTVGYGPDPIACIRMSMSWPVVLLGEFEAATLSDDDLEGWSALAAKQSALWGRGLLRDPQFSSLWSFLAERPRILNTNVGLLIHGGPGDPFHEYIFPEDVRNLQKMARIGSLIPGRCFSGHTHVPGVFIEEASGSWKYLSPGDCDTSYHFDHRKTICNVGSVGQPRDDDWRACYVLFDGETARFRRVEYDIAATIRKINANPELNDWLADRLRKGQ